MRKILLLLALFLGISLSQFGQTTYDWLSSSPDGNWRQGANNGPRWNPDGLWDEPGPNNILRFNNNHKLSMTNNVSSYTINALIFGSGNTLSRTIAGNDLSFIYNNTNPKIENYSTASHTISLNITCDASYPFEINPIDGDLTLSGLINNNGSVIHVWGNNSKMLAFSGIVSGSGKLIVEQYSKVKFSGASTISGNIEIDEGEFWFDQGGAIGGGIIYVGHGSQQSDIAKLWISDSDGGTTVDENIVVNPANAGTKFIGGLNSSGTNTYSGTVLLNGSVNLEANVLGGSIEFTGVISGGNNVTISGSGTTILSATNTYTGTTTVSAGTLVLQGSIANSNVTVSNGAKLVINGTDVTINNLIISSGGEVEVLAGSSFIVDGSDYDFTGTTIIKSTGSMTINGADAEAFSAFTIENDADVTINGAAVTFASDFVIQSNINGTGSLIVNGSSSGNITVERYLSQDKWHYMSAPVDDTRAFNTAGFLDLTGGPNNDQFYYWDESATISGIGTGIWYDILNAENGVTYSNGSFNTSQGYAITKEGANKTISFVGAPFTSNKTINITKTSGSTNPGSNLVGNPFTSTIAANNNADVNSFLSTNIGILDGTYNAIYLWNEKANYLGNRNDYKVISNSETAAYIEVGQAFMVIKKDIGSTALQFNTNMRKHGTSTFYKNTSQDEVSRFYMNVENDEGLYNEILIAFIDGMTNGLDISYDAGKLKGNPNIALYTTLVDDNGADFAHQALPPLDNNVVAVKTGLDVSSAGNYTFKIKELQNFDEGISIKLEDKVTGSIIDFRQAGEYSFYINTPGEIRDRFVLHFNGVLGIEDNEQVTKSNIQTYASNNTLYILNPKMKRGAVNIYNLTGQKVAEFELNGDTRQQQTLNINDIINIVKIQTDNEVISRKVIFK